MIIDNTKFKKTFSKYLKKIIVPFLSEKGYKYGFRNSEGIYWFVTVVENLKFNIDFQIKSYYSDSFDFFYGTTGKITQKLPIIKDHWEIQSENDIEESLMKIKNDITDKLLPWFATVEKIDIDYKNILLDTVSEKLEQINFRFKEDLYCRKIVYFDSRSINDIELFLLFSFLRETQAGYDVIRFEYSEIYNFLEMRFLFYPETIVTKFTSISSIAPEIGNLRFSDAIEYKKIILKLLKAVDEYAEKWFNENRPIKKPDTENWGLFPDLNQNSHKKMKFEKIMKSLPPLE